MKTQVEEALEAELRRCPGAPEDFDHLRLARGVLRTPDEDIPVERIGKGAFSEVYREKQGKRVFAVSSDDTYDKEINEHAYIEGNPHIPKVDKLGTTRDKTVYVMPLYKAPLRKADSPAGWEDYKKLASCHEVSKRKLLQAGKWKHHDLGYTANNMTLDCAKEVGVKPQVVEALESLIGTAADYGSSYSLEVTPRNLATDGAGNLVLLDVMFDREALEKKREKKRRESW